MTLLQLLFSFMQIGLFSIGGGYAAMPLIREQVVTVHGWLTMNEFADLVTIAEMTPGPIAINAATFVGMRVAGVTGVLVATAGNVFPSIVIVSLLSVMYCQYKEMCGFEDGARGEHCRPMKNLPTEQVWTMMEGEREDG